MIPKIIHLCWLSGDPYPTDIQLCLDSWKKHLPDYEIWLWDTKRFDIDSTRWTRQAFDAKKYAFAADACTHYTIMVEYISIQTSLYTKALTLYCLCHTLWDTTRQGASRLP